MPVLQESFGDGLSTTAPPPWTTAMQEEYHHLISNVDGERAGKDFRPVRMRSSSSSSSSSPSSTTEREGETSDWWNRGLNFASAGTPVKVYGGGGGRNGNIDMQIVGGSPVVDGGEFPFFVASGGRTLCGGSLIGPDVVLSAAHCGAAFDKGAYVGGTRILPYDGEWFDVEDVAYHPSYTGSPWYENDIMLIKLSRPSDATPVRLDFGADGPEDDEMLTVIGHGTTSYGGSISKELLQVDVPYMNPTDCFRRTFTNQEISMCAGGEIGKDACSGDSGGPLLTAGDVQVGIVSSGWGCANGMPALYTRVSHYEDWIVETACGMSEANPGFCEEEGSGLVAGAASSQEEEVPKISNPAPTPKPTTTPSSKPTTTPSSKPTPAPSSKPTPAPSSKPSSKPTPAPSSRPTTPPTPRPQEAASAVARTTRDPSAAPLAASDDDDAAAGGGGGGGGGDCSCPCESRFLPQGGVLVEQTRTAFGRTSFRTFCFDADRAGALTQQDAFSCVECFSGGRS